MVRELEQCGAPHMQCSAPVLARLPSALCSHAVENFLEYAAVYFLPIHIISAQFREPNLEHCNKFWEIPMENSKELG
jgi:hypothetical protein